MPRISKRTVARHKANLKQVGGIFGAIKNKIIDKTSDVLAIPARLKSGRVQRQANYDVNVLKADRERGGNTPYPNDESNPMFRTQMNAIEVRDRLTRRNNQ